MLLKHGIGMSCSMSITNLTITIRVERENFIKPQKKTVTLPYSHITDQLQAIRKAFDVDVDVDVDGIHRRMPKPLCPALLHICY